MKKSLRILISCLFVFTILICGITLRLSSQIRSYGTLINHVGIVRGATQRLVKLEISGQPNNSLEIYLDDIILELNSGNGPLGLPMLDDPHYKDCLFETTKMWSDIKKEIHDVRQGLSNASLLSKSEVYFKLVNDMVFAAERYSLSQSSRLAILIITIVSLTLIAWSGILIFYIKKLKRLENRNQTLSDLVFIDKLTGAPNLEKFKLDAQNIILKNRNKKFAILYMDFENFNSLNDIFGFAYGDAILKEYSAVLQRSLRKHEVFCRSSADNFLILRAYEDKSDLLLQQQTLDKKISQFAMSRKKNNLVSIRCGICCREDVPVDLQISDLIERANFARKTVKNHSREHYAFYNEDIHQQMIYEKLIKNEMHAALQNKEFIVYLQPKVSLCKEKIVCAEALVRWKTASQKLIPPGEFIPIFEQNLFIIQLDQYVFEHVCEWLRSQLDLGKPIVPVSVNVSRMQLYEQSFVETYTCIKNRYNIPDNLLEVEFTESVVFENLNLLIEIINDLKAAGFRCSLDDFGNGYSSLNLLKDLPINILKLDRVFFDEEKNLEKARVVVDGIVSIAKKLQLEIVAEGVEDILQVEFLRKICCDMVQGYVFFRPMPIDEMESLLERQASAELQTPQSTQLIGE